MNIYKCIHLLWKLTWEWCKNVDQRNQKERSFPSIKHSFHLIWNRVQKICLVSASFSNWISDESLWCNNQLTYFPRKGGSDMKRSLISEFLLIVRNYWSVTVINNRLMKTYIPMLLKETNHIYYCKSTVQPMCKCAKTIAWFDRARTLLLKEHFFVIFGIKKLKFIRRLWLLFVSVFTKTTVTTMVLVF